MLGGGVLFKKKKPVAGEVFALDEGSGDVNSAPFLRGRDQSLFGAVREKVLHFVFQAEDGIRYYRVTGVQTCALPIWKSTRLNSSHTRLSCDWSSDVCSS